MIGRQKMHFNEKAPQDSGLFLAIFKNQRQMATILTASSPARITTRTTTPTVDAKSTLWDQGN
jgi:hypothetical protein